MTPTESYVKVPIWVWQAREGGQITAVQFNILVFLCRHLQPVKANGKRVGSVMRSYRAESVCSHQGLDASRANLEAYRDALRELQKMKIVWYDYKQGSKRPYNVFLPVGSPFADETAYTVLNDSLSNMNDLCEVLCEENVPSETVSESYSERVTQPVCEPLCERCAKEPVEKESPLNPPSGDFSPAPLPLKGEDAQPAGAAPLFAQDDSGCDSVRDEERATAGAIKTSPKSVGRSVRDRGSDNGTLNIQRCQDFDGVLKGFTAMFTKHGEFVPKPDAARRLLRHYSPLEIWLAYKSDASSLRVRALATWFERGAADTIDVRRQQGTAFEVSLGATMNRPALVDFGKLEKLWCSVFQRALPDLYRVGAAGDKVFYPKSDAQIVQRPSVR